MGSIRQKTINIVKGGERERGRDTSRGGYKEASFKITSL